MSNRHLPAGQSQRGGGVGPMPGGDMNGGVGGHMQQRQPQYMGQYPQNMNPVYANYGPYAHQQHYYGAPPPQQYATGGMPSPGYMPYQNYPRPPPSLPPYAPLVGVSVPPNYHGPAPTQSPHFSTLDHLPPAPIPRPPYTPSSTQSSQVAPPLTPTTPRTVERSPELVAQSHVASQQTPRPRFRPPLPWLSRPDLPWVRKTRPSRKRSWAPSPEEKTVSLPVDRNQTQGSATGSAQTAPSTTTSTQGDSVTEPASSTQQSTSSSPTTPKSSGATDATSGGSVGVTTASVGVDMARSTAPAVRALPVVPKPVPKPPTAERPKEQTQKPVCDGIVDAQPPATASVPPVHEAEPNGASTVRTAPARPPPTSWASLFAKTTPKAPPNAGHTAGGRTGDGDSSIHAKPGDGGSFSMTNACDLGQAVRLYHVGGNNRVSFLEPRGLSNASNMCYLNSVLQSLIFCPPFYALLDQISRSSTHKFISETPLLDSMVLLLREYRVLKSAPSVLHLNQSLKSEDLERYGDPFTPKFVYEAIGQLPLFASMNHGHQEDAEEFLGFLLQSLHDECAQAMSHSAGAGSSDISTASVTSSDGWLEVGRKKRTAVTRSSGDDISTPITQIFGGLLRSELRVPGLPHSITTERYLPLQLDIASPGVKNVTDALRGITHPEPVQGDFQSPRGKDVVVTKQVFIESLPPVLILHLKRFEYDAKSQRSVKIWKQIGYPLDLEIPREVLSRTLRQTMDERSAPKYKLISVIYHHGNNASGGHYSADVRRQDDREWINLDDTKIRRVRSEDVAAAGCEVDVKDILKKLGVSSEASDRVESLKDFNTAIDQRGWEHLQHARKQWSSVGRMCNGLESLKLLGGDFEGSKVAYLLFYQRV